MQLVLQEFYSLDSFYSHFAASSFAMSVTQSTSSAGDASQSVKEDHRTRFNTKFNAWSTSKKQKPNIESDENYDQIVNAVEQWATGERFNGLLKILRINWLSMSF